MFLLGNRVVGNQECELVMRGERRIWKHQIEDQTVYFNYKNSMRHINVPHLARHLLCIISFSLPNKRRRHYYSRCLQARVTKSLCSLPVIIQLMRVRIRIWTQVFDSKTSTALAAIPPRCALLTHWSLEMSAEAKEVGVFNSCSCHHRTAL